MPLGAVEEQEVRQVGELASDRPRVRRGHEFDRQRAAGGRLHWHRVELEWRAGVHE
ncbi:MAG: hypothetical protein ACKODX_09920 [Gemmata sp.]